VTFSDLSRDPNVVAEAFPWARHLDTQELGEFVHELVTALSDITDSRVDANADEVIAGWRATARIKADQSEYVRALQETSGDLGSVETVPLRRFTIEPGEIRHTCVQARRSR
jgi:hypothetical protein